MGIYIIHRAICVRDIDVSTRFYAEAFQFSPAQDYGYLEGKWLEEGIEIKGVSMHPLYLRNPQGVSIELMHFKHPEAFGSRERRAINQYGLTHLAFSVADLEFTAAKIDRAGGRALRDTQVFYAASGAKIMFCTDPDGVRIEIVSAPGLVPALSHYGICVEDIAASTGFYRVLGFEPAEAHDLTEQSSWLAPLTELRGCKMKTLVVRDADGNGIEFIKMLEPKSFGPRERRALNQYGLTHHCFRVDDLDDTTLKLCQHGGRVFPHTRGRYGDMEMLHLADPDGVHVELVKEHRADQTAAD